jgi:hypothetical protein
MESRQAEANIRPRPALALCSPGISRSVLALIPILSLALCGCGSGAMKTEISDATGSNRLVLINRETSSFIDWLQGRRGYDFDSLVWRTNSGSGWHDHMAISKHAFQGTNSRMRWITEIHSIDPTNGTAIIKVAEGNAPDGSPYVGYVYTWREWSLSANSEVRLIRVCADPFEKYEGIPAH